MKHKPHGIVIAVLTVILLAAVGGFGYYAYRVATQDIQGINQPATEYTLVIEKSDFAEEVSLNLKNNGIIINDILWMNWMENHYPKFQYINGEYAMRADMSYEEIAQKLQHPDISHKTVKVAVPEGYNVMQIAKTLEENGVCKAEAFLEVCKSTEGFDYEWISEIPDNPLIAYKLEGFLFPATYDLAQNSEPHEVADAMLEAFDYRLTEEMRAFCRAHDMTLYELITLASVVQEEAFSTESAENIASVFMNRLKKGAKLQSDVTYFYARDLRDTYGFSQEVYDAYYTYRCAGLPAGPISNSGEAIVQATVQYPQTEYLYFFSDLKKEFHFAATYDEFLALQKQYPWKE